MNAKRNEVSDIPSAQALDSAALQVTLRVINARAAGSQETLVLPGANLSGAELICADLSGAELTAVNLEGALLSGAKFDAITLAGANLRGADLNGADLTGADLRGADLSRCRLEGASLADTDMRGANLGGVMGQPSSVAGARIDSVFCERSRLTDVEIIQLWNAGVHIDDASALSATVQQACGEIGASASTPMGPSPRLLSGVEVHAHKQAAAVERRHRSAFSMAAITPEEIEELAAATTLPPRRRISPVRNARDLGTSEGPDADESDAGSATRDGLAIAAATAPPSVRSRRLTADDASPSLIAASPWEAGDRLMGAVLDEQIGTGSTGAVWRGFTDDGETVALKLFDFRRAHDGLKMTAFRRSVAMANRMPVVNSEDFSLAQIRCVSLNQLGYVMDFVENGSSLDLPALGLRVADTVKFVERLATGIGWLHQRGFVHRCIKPSNVLVDHALMPVIVDVDGADLPTLRRSGRRAGGYRAYAPPEELLGQGTQSPTADIYSLGRMLYFLLTGRQPPLRDEALPELAELKKVPEGLTRVIRKATTRDPRRRYPYVEDFVADLINYRNAQEVGLPFDERTMSKPPPRRVSGLIQQATWLGAASDRPQGSLPPIAASLVPSILPRPEGTSSGPPNSAIRPAQGGSVPDFGGSSAPPTSANPSVHPASRYPSPLQSAAPGVGGSLSPSASRYPVSQSIHAVPNLPSATSDSRRRSVEVVVGTLGALLLLGALFWIALFGGGVSSTALRLVVAGATGMTSAWIPVRWQPKWLWRLLLGLAFAGIGYALNAPHLMAV